MQDGVIHSHLLVGDGAVLLKHLLTHLLLGGEEVGLVGVVALLHRLVNTVHHRILPGNKDI